MTSRADTDLLWLQTRAYSLTGVDCYRKSAAECEQIIRDHDSRQPVFAGGVLERLHASFHANFGQVFGR